MCKIYNTIGCLTEIQSRLRWHNIYEYRSPNELIDFQQNYSSARQQILSEHKIIIEQEKFRLANELPKLVSDIQTKRSEIERLLKSELETLKEQLNSLPAIHATIIHKFFNSLKKVGINRDIKNHELNQQDRIDDSLKYLTDYYNTQNNRHNYITSQYNDAVIRSAGSQIQKLEKEKLVIDELKNFIHGAIGEQKVVEKLKELSDDYVLINDFKCVFRPAIYNRKENDHIQSVQIDHILISPAGVFLIETKNWSQHSINDSSLFSPVKQIRRSNFVLYILLNGKNSALNRHRWGKREIPIKNVIVFIDNAPKEKFEHVHIKPLNGLLSLIKYFQPCLSSDEVQTITGHLLGNIAE